MRLDTLFFRSVVSDMLLDKIASADLGDPPVLEDEEATKHRQPESVRPRVGDEIFFASCQTRR